MIPLEEHMPPKSILKRLASEMLIKRECSPSPYDGDDDFAEAPAKRLCSAREEPLDLSTCKKSPTGGEYSAPTSPASTSAGSSALKKRLLRDYLSDTAASPAVSPVPIPAPREVSPAPLPTPREVLIPDMWSTRGDARRLTVSPARIIERGGSATSPSPLPVFMSPPREESYPCIKSPVSNYPCLKSPVSRLQATYSAPSSMLSVSTDKYRMPPSPHMASMCTENPSRMPPMSPGNPGIINVQDKIHMSGGAVSSSIPHISLPVEIPHSRGHAVRYASPTSPRTLSPSPYRYECKWVQLDNAPYFPGFSESVNVNRMSFDNRFCLSPPSACLNVGRIPGSPHESLQKPSQLSPVAAPEKLSHSERSPVSGKETFRDRFLSHLMRKSQSHENAAVENTTDMYSRQYSAPSPSRSPGRFEESLHRSASMPGHSRHSHLPLVPPAEVKPRPTMVDGFALPVPVTDAQLYRAEATEKVQVSFRGLSGGSVRTFPVSSHIKTTAVVKPYKLSH